MIELLGLSDPIRNRRITIGRFPASLGRAPGNGVVLEAPGVWDHHLRFEWVRGDGIHVRAVGEAPLWVNDRAVREARLSSGDILTFGGARVRFQLSPVRIRRRVLATAATWALIVGTLALELWLLNRAEG